MAENNEYHIYVHLDDFADGKGAVAGTGAGSVGGNETPAEDNSADGVVRAAKNLVSFAAAASLADKLISYEISQVSLETGASEYEQRLSTTYSIAKQSIGAGAALIGAGIMGGPAGLAVAAIGLVSAGVNKLIGIAQKERTLQTEQALENVSIGMAQVRAGTAGRRNQDQ